MEIAISRRESIADAKIATEPLNIPTVSFIMSRKKATAEAVRAALFSIVGALKII